MTMRRFIPDTSAGWVLMLLIAGLMAGCASKKDTRYLQSHRIAPLSVPAGLDTPPYTQSMEIPAPATRRTDGETASEVDGDVDLEIPPRRIQRP